MKKNAQLGMNASTASGRLVKDLLFKFVKEAGHVCHRCGGELTRETFSIDHKDPWLDSGRPVELFFDLDNVAFSHHRCNIVLARRLPKTSEHGVKARYTGGCRCDECREAMNIVQRRHRKKKREKI